MAENRYRPRLAASFAALAVVGAAAGCSHSTAVKSTTTTRPRPGTPTNPVPPSVYSVGAERFLESIDVGGTVLLVSPPPKDAAPSVTAVQAASMFDAYEAFNGIYKFELLGLGVATLDQTPSHPSQATSYLVPTATTAKSTTTTTRVVPTTTTVPHPTTTTTTAPPPTTTTTIPPTTTTAPPISTTTTIGLPTTTTTTAPTTTTTAPPPKLYDQTLAWVGIAVGQSPACAGGTPATVAIVINAYTGQDVVAVAAGGCETPAPVVATHPVELESVPWSAVGPTSTAIAVDVPACGSYVGWTEITIGSATATQVEAAVPYSPQCADLAPVQKIVNLVVPLGGGQSVPHAPTGPVDNLQVL
jgi:hypothetical protein